MANCVGCNSDRTSFYRLTADGMLAYCSVCSGRTPANAIDVAYPYGSGTHTEENIAYPNGHPQAGQPIPFSSRRGKLEAMRMAGVRESGDRIHGAINCQTSKKKIFFT